VSTDFRIQELRSTFAVLVLRTYAAQEACAPASFVALKTKDHKTERLLEILRGISVSSQEAKPRVFYPVREVARHFRVPISTVARVYTRLEDEGILASIRGSRTLLQGLNSGRQLSVHAFVGMPASTAAFVTSQDYRTFFIRVRRELRARGFAVAMILFRPRDVKSDQLFKRIEKQDFDTVLWYRPDVSSREITSRLKDLGVKVLGISDGGAPSIRCRYEVRRDGAINSILDDWRSKSGITEVVIVQGARASGAKEEFLEALVNEHQLHCKFASTGSQRPEEFLESLANNRGVGLIFPSQTASMFAFRAPEALMRLMANSRVAFTGGAPSFPFTQVTDVTADLVIVDWQLIAERIVDDLLSKRAFDSSEMSVFHAQPQLRVSISHYAESL
jgi:hypothetical protein